MSKTQSANFSLHAHAFHAGLSRTLTTIVLLFIALFDSVTTNQVPIY